MVYLRIVVTGHRPKKLNNCYNINDKIYIDIARQMRRFILSKMKELKNNEKIIMVSGMALGIDTIWALVALKLKKQYPNIVELECFVPCKDHSSNWFSETDKRRHADILKEADKVNIADYEYKKDGPKVMQIRNIAMINSLEENSEDCVLAVWDGTNGGTGNCVKSAEKKNIDVFKLHPFKLNLEIHKSVNTLNIEEGVDIQGKSFWKFIKK